MNTIKIGAIITRHAKEVIQKRMLTSTLPTLSQAAQTSSPNVSPKSPEPIVKSVTEPKTAILMLNMGGPECNLDVEEYLRRIMTDKEMIQLPLQSQLGPWIAKRRTAEVTQKYEDIGGGSPILKWTNIQGELLCQKLDQVSPETAPHKHYVGFRYADPLTEDSLDIIREERPSHVVLFSQYPQYCCATSGSSFNSIYNYFRGKPMPPRMTFSVIDRWAWHPLLADTFAERIQDELNAFDADIRDEVVILFSAHSIPLKTVSRGDAYPSEVGGTVQNVMQRLKFRNPYSLVWQSKVGPLPWLEPFTDKAIGLYVKQGHKNFILVPIAFVNEHIETLHELDIEYCQELAEKVGATQIRRAAAPNDHPKFIQAMTEIVADHLKSGIKVSPKFLLRCPHCKFNHCLSAKKWYTENFVPKKELIC